ncbi:MAG: hypothetical protein MZU91_11520 [Desulfosudis oleivorans]|nr:hypothetical protein [Desulfosudis oleivorans]
MIKAAFPLGRQGAGRPVRDPLRLDRPPRRRRRKSRPCAGSTSSEGSGEYGVALLNDSKYGFDVKGGVMRMSVVHGATYPDPEADRGRQELLYSIFPHGGDWKGRGGDAERPGAQQPAHRARADGPRRAHCPRPTPSSRPGRRTSSCRRSRRRWATPSPASSSGSTRSTAKRPRPGSSSPGRSTPARPTSSSARRATPLGSGQVITVPLAPYEIKTIRVVRK